MGAEIAVENLPLSPALRDYAGAERAPGYALSGGDDYELLLCIPPNRWADAAAAAAAVGLSLSAVGRICAGAGVTWSMNGAAFQPSGAGYEHFRQ